MRWPLSWRTLRTSDQFTAAKGKPAMPTIRVDMFEGRTHEQKRALVAAITEACVRTIGAKPESVDILLFDIAKQNWATAGTLWSDKAAPAKPIQT
jgi:4-oxalocrotonate tautomerase